MPRARVRFATATVHLGYYNLCEYGNTNPNPNPKP